MEVLFYFFSFFAVVSAISVVFNIYPIYALLCLIIHCISLSCIFFIVDACLAGVLEIIIYAGAIMVLFVFVIMMLNVDSSILLNDSLIITFDFKKLFLIFMFFIVMIYFIWGGSNDFYVNSNINSKVITLKNIGISLFGDYLLIIEMASILLLGSLIISLRIVKEHS